LFCQTTITEAGTGNISIIRIFTNFMMSGFPSLTWPFLVFVQLVGGIGRYNVTVEVHDLRDGAVIARAEGPIEFRDRIQGQNMLIPVPPLQIQHEGAYDIVLLAHGQEIDRQQFTVTLLEEPQQ